MAEEEGSGPEEEEAQKDRRVKPLLRFMRRKGEEPFEGEEGPPAGEPEDPEDVSDGDEDKPHRVRPVRVVKFVPTEGGPEEAIPEESVEAPFTEVPEEPVSSEVSEEVPFEEVSEEVPFEEVPEEVPFEEVPDEVPFEEVPDEPSAPDRPVVPEIPFDELRHADAESAVEGGITEQEDRELGADMGFREEETPTSWEGPNGKGPLEDLHHPGERPEGPPPQAPEDMASYHKYLRPDEELLQRRPAKGRPTGFDRDLETDAGEIDLGIDLIDPSERRKKAAPPKPRKEQKLPKGAVGGHDFDGEMGTRELGVDIGVDYEKRRKRRL